MIRAVTVLVAAVSSAALTISACASLDATSASQTRSPIERADAAYGRIRTLAEVALLVVPVGRGAAVRAWLNRADRALVAAQLSRDLEQLHHLQELGRSAEGLASAVAADRSGHISSRRQDRP